MLAPRISGIHHMADPASLDAYIAAAARVLDLPIDPAWQPAVRANLELTLRLAAAVAEFPLPDEADAAPVFEA
jgi:Protein of unknown function (DUF4089)